MADCPFPYLVALHNHGSFICGGSIITPLWILTAAHCLSEFDDPQLSIRAGSPDRTRGGVLRTVAEFFIHPYFVVDTYDCDVALLRLDSSLPLGSCIRCIPMVDSRYKVRIGSIGQVAGWGHTDPDLTVLPKYMQSTRIPVMDKKECKFKYHQYPVTRNMFCAEDFSGHADTCKGDSGGPYTLDGYLVGIISWGLECAGRDQPGVYTNVAVMRWWIDSTVGYADLRC